MKDIVQLRPPFADLWKDQDPFLAVEQLTGPVYREVKARRTLKFEAAGNSFFAKIHRGIGWREIFKDLLQLRAPVLGARNEWQAIHRLNELGVPTMTAVAYGERGSNPASRRSFIVTEELDDHTDLEAYCAHWVNRPPGFRAKLSLLRVVADMAGRLHRGGVCHRDFYLCHFLRRNTGEDLNELRLIDLHRALIKPRLARRWIIKDLAGLYFSAMEIGLTRTDLLRFIEVYAGKPWRDALRDDESLWRRVNSRAHRMFKRHQRSR